jgi:hypothetical protein
MGLENLSKNDMASLLERFSSHPPWLFLTPQYSVYWSFLGLVLFFFLFSSSGLRLLGPMYLFKKTRSRLKKILFWPFQYSLRPLNMLFLNLVDESVRPIHIMSSDHSSRFRYYICRFIFSPCFARIGKNTLPKIFSDELGGVRAMLGAKSNYHIQAHRI